MDPRVVRTRTAVHYATLAVLGRFGYAAFTVEAVAAEAGVSKSTIYRHWPTKIALIADSLEVLNQQPCPEISGHTARVQIRQLLEHLASIFDDSLISRCIPALIEAAEHQPEVAEFLYTYNTRRRQKLIDTVQRGVDTGELPDHLDSEITALALIGPIIYTRTMTSKPLTGHDVQRIIDTILGPSTGA